MNKAELVSALAAKTGETKKSTESFVNSFVDIVTSELKSNNKVQLIGFGTFETRSRAARTGHNPQTGAAIKIAACKSPAFKPGKALKNSVNN